MLSNWVGAAFNFVNACFVVAGSAKPLSTLNVSATNNGDDGDKSDNDDADYNVDGDDDHDDDSDADFDCSDSDDSVVKSSKKKVESQSSRGRGQAQKTGMNNPASAATKRICLLAEFWRCVDFWYVKSRFNSIMCSFR